MPRRDLQCTKPYISRIKLSKGMFRVRTLSHPVTFLIYFILTFGSFTLSSNLSVQLTQSFTPSGNILIRCSATGPLATQSVIRLGCTSDDIGICRENCSRPCITRDGVPDCSNKKPDGVFHCTYKEISKEQIEVVYELAPDELTPDGKWWCNFRGRNSQKISSQSIKRASASTSTNPNLLTSPMAEIKPRFEMTTVSKNQPETKKRVFTPDLILIIIIGTIVSTILNLLLFIRCLTTRKYIKKIASGGQRNMKVEACLCIRKLAKTYRPPPRRPAKLSGSNISWPTQVRCEGRQQMAPMSEPIKRRFAPVPNERPPAGFGRFSSPYLPVQGVPLSQFSGEPLIIEESLYDDVPPSSVYPSDGQSNRMAAPNQTLSPASRRARKCIVDAEGTVYVAVGHVSNAQSVHSGLGDSRVNLVPASASSTPRTLRTSQSRLQQRSPSAARPPPARYMNGYAAANGLYNTPLLDQGGLNDPFRTSLGNHQSPLPSLPPASATSVGSSSSGVAPKGMAGLISPTSLTIGTRAIATRAKVSSAGISQSYNVNPPSAFDDQFSEDEEMDDLFSLATDRTTKPGKNP